jgi:hypothetical protein
MDELPADEDQSSLGQVQNGERVKVNATEQLLEGQIQEDQIDSEHQLQVEEVDTALQARPANPSTENPVDRGDAQLVNPTPSYQQENGRVQLETRPETPDRVSDRAPDLRNLNDTMESIDCMPETPSRLVCLRRALKHRGEKRDRNDKRVSFDPLTLLVTD